MKRIVVAAFALAVIGLLGNSGTAHAQTTCAGDGKTYTKGRVACQSDTQQECTEDGSWKDLGIPCHEVVVGRPGMVVITEEDELKIFQGYTLCCAGSQGCVPACGWCINGCAAHACKDGATVLECNK